MENLSGCPLRGVMNIRKIQKTHKIHRIISTLQILGLSYFWLTSYKLELPTIPSSDSISCYHDSQNSRTHFTYIYWFIRKCIIKIQMNSQAKRQPGQDSEGPECGSFRPLRGGVCPFLAHRCVHQPRRSPNPVI